MSWYGWSRCDVSLGRGSDIRGYGSGASGCRGDDGALSRGWVRWSGCRQVSMATGDEQWAEAGCAFD